MRQGIGLAVILAVGGLFMSLPAHAACPGYSHDGKSISVSGRISKIEARAKTYADGTNSTHVITLKECDSLEILAKKPRGCKRGSAVTARGEYFMCDDDSYDFGECDVDELDSVSLTCQ